jgi:hypothetical protein
MTDEPFKVAKYGHTVSISGLLAEPDALSAAIRRAMSATPQERAQARREYDRRNAEERAAAEYVPLTLESLVLRLEDWGWSREYVEHLVQPYCKCEDGRDGWEFCQHARDLGLTP